MLRALDAGTSGAFVIRIIVLASASSFGFASALLLLHVNFVHVNFFNVFAVHVDAKRRSPG